MTFHVKGWESCNAAQQSEALEDGDAIALGTGVGDALATAQAPL